MIEKPYEGKAKIKFDGSGMFIKIPSRKNLFLILFSVVWLGGWFMGETFAINEVKNTDNIAADSFILIWLIGWTFGGIFVVAVLLWTLFGHEKIVIDRGVFSISKGIFDFDLFKKNYDLASIKNLELNPDSPDSNNIFGNSKKWVNSMDTKEGNCALTME